LRAEMGCKASLEEKECTGREAKSVYKKEKKI
jgi:hypothetical protein